MNLTAVDSVAGAAGGVVPGAAHDAENGAPVSEARPSPGPSAPAEDRPGGRRTPAVDGREVAAIFGGGALGALARAGLSEAFPAEPGSWPWPTFAVNVIGAFMLGYFVTRLHERLPPTRYRRPFLGTGVCGALTTFSTMQVELLQMLDHHDYALAAAYAGASIAAGFVAVWAATSVVRRVRLVA
jgi:CrcB protein